MKWLSVEDIKKHSRIDYDCDDALLELYGEAAEEEVMHILGRDYKEIVSKYGTDEKPVPAAIRQATLLIVDESYQFRTAASPQNIVTTPTVEALLAYYIKHTVDESENE